MNYTKTDPINQFTVGFEHIFRMMEDMQGAFKALPSYPPYNITKIADNTYAIEMAVAGFGKQDLEITLEGGVLKIRGLHSSKTEDTNYIFKGLAERSFQRSFTIADSIEIRNAELANGMLRILLENAVPEKKIRKIEINTHDAVDDNTGRPIPDFGYLTE